MVLLQVLTICCRGHNWQTIHFGTLQTQPGPVNLQAPHDESTTTAHRPARAGTLAPQAWHKFLNLLQNQFESIRIGVAVWSCMVLFCLSWSWFVYVCLCPVPASAGSSLGAVAASLTFIVSHGFVHLGYDGSKWHAMLLWRIEASSYFTTWRLTQSPSSNCKRCNLQECHESGASVGASRSLKFRARSRSPKTGTETTTKWPI
jgi:hypothetical protein